MHPANIINRRIQKVVQRRRQSRNEDGSKNKSMDNIKSVIDLDGLVIIAYSPLRCQKGKTSPLCS